MNSGSTLDLQHGADIIKQRTRGRTVKWFVDGERIRCIRDAAEKVIARRESIGSLDKGLVVMVKDADGNLEKLEQRWWDGETAKNKRN